MEVNSISNLISQVNAEEYGFLANEWRSGSILSPFYLLSETVANPPPQYAKHRGGGSWLSDKICTEVAEMFLDCTAYRTTEDSLLQEGEKSLLTSLFYYIYYEAPTDEQHMAMICELVAADIEKDYSIKTNLERLFEMLREKNPSHSALVHFDAYLANSYGRARISKSLRRRLYPLFSFRCDNSNIFEFCGDNEIFEMALGLLHNCGGEIESATSLKHKKDELAFVAAGLHVMHEVLEPKEQTVTMFNKLMDLPSRIDELIKKHPQAVKAKKYWQVCRNNVLDGKYSHKNVDAIAGFYMEFS